MAVRRPRAFLGEETGHADFPGSTGIWVVDPIDWTQPFLPAGRRAQVSDFLGREGLLSGAPIVAGPPAVYDDLVAVLGG